MNKLFNSTFENAIRLLVLLNECDMPQTIDKLYVLDFLALYGASFGITEQNLNGDNAYKFSVFASHRESIKEAIKELVLNRTVQAVNYNNALSYIVTPEGEDFCELLDSEYAKEYKKNVQMVIRYTANKSERALISAIYKLSAESFREESIK